MKKLPDNQKKQYLQKQYLRLVENIAKRTLKETALDKDDIQKLIKNENKFRTHIIAGIKDILMSHQFTNNEEVKSSYTYPEDYKVKSISEQIKILRQLFPGIGSVDKKLAKQPLHLGAEGWFAIPRWEKIAPTYNEAVQKVLDLIKRDRNGRFINYRENQLGPQYLRQSQKSIKAFKELGNKQKNCDILVVPAQFGLLHRGQSVHLARDAFMANEFGLGVFAIGIMLLTHPEREVRQEQLHIDCAGDEFSLNADNIFSDVPFFTDMPFFTFDDRFDFLSLDAIRYNYADEYSGSASAFLSR